MLKQKGKKLNTLSALIVATLAFGAFATASLAIKKNSSGLALFASANGGDSGDSDNDDSDSGSDSNSGGSGGESVKKATERSAEDQKKHLERAKESAKKQFELTREAAKNAAEGRGEEHDSNENGRTTNSNVHSDDSGQNAEGDSNDGSIDRNGDGVGQEKVGENKGVFKDRNKTIAGLNEKIAEAEKEILAKQAEGIDVTAALARLAMAKESFTSVNGAFDSNDLEAAKNFSRDVKKLAHFAVNEDLHTAKKTAEKISKVSERILQTESKIAQLESLGGDGSQFTKSLSGVKSDLALLEQSAGTSGTNLGALESSLEALAKRAKMIKNSVEGSLFALGGSDDNFKSDYENEAEDIVKHLKDVAEIEDDNVGKTVLGLARDQENSAKKVSRTVANMDERNKVLQLLFGTNKSDISTLEGEIAANKKRSEVLTQAANVMEDQDLKKILLDQVTTLEQETSKLESFVSGQNSRSSAFGWFFNLFSK